MDHHKTARILVAGSGPAGLIAALGFAEAGFAVTLAGPEANGQDGRTTA
ncbi:UbiH/UbiF family hydroxylase, partial [Mesorhizobium sp. M4B.F.Ca.ET.013.02.1.1]